MPEYINNKILTAEIIACQKTMVISDKLATMLMLLVERTSLSPNWRGYSFLADMRAEALLQLVKYNGPKGRDSRPNILKFDPGYAERAGKTPNGFAYATQIILNAFRRAVKVEGGLANLRDDLLEEAKMLPSFKRQVHNEENRSADPLPDKRPKGRPLSRKS